LKNSGKLVKKFLMTRSAVAPNVPSVYRGTSGRHFSPRVRRRRRRFRLLS
jgi:hypothetical protein